MYSSDTGCCRLHTDTVSWRIANALGTCYVYSRVLFYRIYRKTTYKPTKALNRSLNCDAYRSPSFLPPSG